MNDGDRLFWSPSRVQARTAIVMIVLSWAIGGAVPALIALGIASAIYDLSSPDRFFDALYLVAFCGVGYLAS